MAVFSFFLIYSFVLFETKAVFSEDIRQCNFIEKELRFSCYRSIIEKHYKGNLEKFLGKIENDTPLIFKGKDTSYAIFGTNCHTFYHAAGDFIATNNIESDIQSALNLCSLACTDGCMMGLYKRIALQNGFSTNLLKEF